MDLTEKTNLLKKIFQAVAFKKRFPLAIMWSLTYRCNLNCSYCGAGEKNKSELDTKSVIDLINQAYEMGVKFITFSGGEVLLRDDLPKIINTCKDKSIYVLINSNGTLIKKDFWKIKGVDEIQISLDGTKEINDALRGEGVHDKVLDALEICKKNNINTLLNTVLSKQSLSCVPYILTVSKKYNVPVYFQPVSQTLSHNSSENIHSLYGPNEDEFKKTISFLINEKKKGNKLIKNSIVGLKHLANWPHPHYIDCIIKQFFFIIEPDGKMFLCDCFPNYQKYLIPIDKNIKTTYTKLSMPHKCTECWSGSLPDINLFKSPSVDNLINLWERFVNMIK